MNLAYIELETIGNLLQQGYSIQEVIELCNTLFNSKTIQTLTRKLEAGQSLQEGITISGYPTLFVQYFSLYLSKNDLSYAILQSIQTCRQKIKRKKEIQKQLLYPSFLLLFLIVFSIFIVLFLLPQVRLMLHEFSVTISLFQNVVFSLFTILPILLVCVVLLTTGVCVHILYCFKTNHYQQMTFYLAKKGIGALITKYYSYQVAVYYNELLVHGYDSSLILTTLMKQTENKQIASLFYGFYQVVETGKSLLLCFEESAFIEPLFLIYFKIMQTRKEDQRNLTDYIELTSIQLSNFITRVLKIVVPSIYLFVGCFVLFVYLSIILPLMDIVSIL